MNSIRSHRTILLCCTVSAILVVATGLFAQQPSTIFKRKTAAAIFTAVHTDLLNLQPDPAKYTSIKNLTIRRDAGAFRLDQGELWFCTPVAGKVRAAVFIGNGTFSFAAPNTVERGQLRRFFNKDTLSEPFTSCVFIFADTTETQLKRTGSFSSKSISSLARSEVDNARRQVAGAEIGVDPEFLQAYLEDEQTDLFYADVQTTSVGELFYEVDPTRQSERIILMRLQQDSVADRHRETVCQFATMGNDEDVTESIIGIQSYVFDCAIPADLTLSVEGRITMLSLAADRHWIPLALMPTLRVDSAAWSDKDGCAVFQLPNGNVWIYRRTPLLPNSMGTLYLRYSGKYINRQQDWFSMYSSMGWYPNYGYLNRAMFDIRFRVHKQYGFVCVGDQIEDTTDGDFTVTRWVTREPIRNCTFNLGLFNSCSVAKDSIPRVIVLTSRNGHSSITDTLNKSVTSDTTISKQVASDLAESIRLFQTLFGVLPQKNVYATEIAQSHGEAFPGLIHLPWSTFQTNDQTGFGQLFRAHETGHQWWGIGVDFRSYHDLWLSEGFAEYSGLLYLQSILKDDEKMFKMLRNYKEQLLNNRKAFLAKGQEATPIVLGNRVESSTTPGNFNKIIYYKGAWVLHMIRCMLLDHRTMSEDVFMGLMKGFYKRYAGKRASTSDFQKAVEKATNTDMSWFFRQWVQESAIPKYTVSFKTGRTGDGKYRVLCNVRQSNVPDDFVAYVLVKVGFGPKYQPVLLRVKVTGANSTITLPVLPLEPKEFIFNDQESVLCEVEKVDWKE